jgi:hypothetical protein
LEVSSLVCLAALRALYPTYFALPRSYYETPLRRIDPGSLSRFARSRYDPELGWVNPPGTESESRNRVGETWSVHYDSAGARANPVPFKRAIVSAYGDSFTHCDEVNDDETWPYFLSQLTRSNVQNFGVPAYGTDQAELRFEKNLARGLSTPVVILAIYDENINRIVNRYRPFYLPKARMLLAFKPRYKLVDGSLFLLRNPLQPDLVGSKDLLGALEIARHDDYWAERNEERTRLRPPFSAQLARLLIELAAKTGLVGSDRTATSLWDEAPARELMEAIVGRFVGLCRAKGIEPVVVLIPDLGAAWPRSSGYAEFVTGLRSGRFGAVPVVVDLGDGRTDMTRPVLSIAHGHASRSGNLAIASRIYDELEPVIEKRAPLGSAW